MIEMPSSHAIARGLRELLVGENPLEIRPALAADVRRHDHYGRSGAALHVISAIDIALWDIAGKAAGRPVCELLGGARVPSCRSTRARSCPRRPTRFGRSPDAPSPTATARSSSAGARSVRDLDHDEELVRAARDALGPDRVLMIDGGRAYTVKRALELLRRLEDAGLYWLEEPLAAGRLRGLPPALRRRRRAHRGRRGRLAVSALPRARRARARRRAPAGYRPLRRLHGRPRDRARSRAGGASRSFPTASRRGVLVAASLHFAATLDRPTFSEFSVADSPLVSGLLAEPFRLRGR